MKGVNILEKIISNQSPRMMTIREIAKTGLLPENALRTMLKQGRVPHIMVGCKALINYDKLVQLLEDC